MVTSFRLKVTVDDINYKSCITLRILNYGNYGIFLIMGNDKDVYHEPQVPSNLEMVPGLPGLLSRSLDSFGPAKERASAIFFYICFFIICS